jgi:NitT/TauT family transport system substrate-binding protein
VRLKPAVPDLISNSFFPAVAAVERGFFKKDGLDVIPNVWQELQTVV